MLPGFAVFLVLPGFAVSLVLPGFSASLVLPGFAVSLVLPFALSHSPGGGAVRSLPVQDVWFELVIVQLVLL